jgi:hypothetical protein
MISAERALAPATSARANSHAVQCGIPSILAQWPGEVQAVLTLGGCDR